MAKTFLEKALPLAGAVTSFVPEIFKFFAGQKQIRQANAINPSNPGFVANPGIIDNNRIAEQRYLNYQMPGYGMAQNNIVQNGATAFNRGVQGASSSADVLNLTQGINYTTGQQLNALAEQNALGAEDALNTYMQTNQMAGNELVRKNMFDLDEYQRQLDEKAALLQAGNQNRFGAGDNIADGLRYFTQPQQQLIQPGVSGGVTNQGSIFRR